MLVNALNQVPTSNGNYSKYVGYNRAAIDGVIKVETVRIGYVVCSRIPVLATASK